jgi:catechol 2,3-dioxygenase-like lactoylglutathione lyase family enzyme
MSSRTKRKVQTSAKRAKPAAGGTAGTAHTAAIDVPGLFRVILHVGDLGKAERFYTSLLGAQGRAVGGGRVYFDCGPVILALLDPTSGGTKPRPFPDFVYFTVRDLERVHARAEQLDCLEEAHVHGEPAGEIVVRPWGERSFYTVDPWGNGLCFVEEPTKFTGKRR